MSLPKAICTAFRFEDKGPKGFVTFVNLTEHFTVRDTVDLRVGKIIKHIQRNISVFGERIIVFAEARQIIKDGEYLTKDIPSLIEEELSDFFVFHRVPYNTEDTAEGGTVPAKNTFYMIVAFPVALKDVFTVEGKHLGDSGNRNPFVVITAEEIRLVVTHLNVFPDLRRLQRRQLCEYLGENGPEKHMILLGDLNLHAKDGDVVATEEVIGNSPELKEIMDAFPKNSHRARFFFGTEPLKGTFHGFGGGGDKFAEEHITCKDEFTNLQNVVATCSPFELTVQVHPMAEPKNPNTHPLDFSFLRDPYRNVTDHLPFTVFVEERSLHRCRINTKEQ